MSGIGTGSSRRVAATTLVQLAGRAALMALGLASVAILTRYLGPAGYGRYGLAFSYTQLFGVLADVGLYTVLVRELSREPGRTRELAGAALTLRVGLSLAVVAGCALVSLALPYAPAVRVAILIAGGALVLDLATGGLRAIFHARLRMGRAVAAQVAGRAVAVAGVGAVAAAGLGLHAAVATAVAGAAAALALTWVFARRIVPGLRPRVDRDVWRGLVGASAVLGLALAINEVYFRADTVIISLYRSYREVGLYSLDYRLLDAMLAVPGVFLAAVFPVISRLAAHDEEGRLPGVIQRAGDAFVLVGVPLAAGGAVLAPAILRLAGGARYGAGADALALLMGAGALVSINGLFGFSLIAADRQAQALWLNVSALAFNLILNLALVPRLGIDAAAAVTLGGEAVILAGSRVLMRRHFGFFPSFAAPLIRAVLAAAVMTAVLWPLRDGPAAATVPLGAVVYAVVLWLDGGIDRDVVRRLRAPA